MLLFVRLSSGDDAGADAADATPAAPDASWLPCAMTLADYCATNRDPSCVYTFAEAQRCA